MQLTGQVKSVSVKPTKFPGKNKLSIKIDQDPNWYGFFGDNTVLNGGEVVAFSAEVTPDGKWWNGSALRVISGQQPTHETAGAYFDKAVPQTALNTLGPAAQAQQTGRAVDPDREARIVRQNATTSAIAMFGHIITLDPEHYKSLTRTEHQQIVEELHHWIYELNMNAPQGA